MTTDTAKASSPSPKPTPKSSSKQVQTIDLERELEIWAINVFKATSSANSSRLSSRKVKVEQLDLSLIWDQVTIEHDKPEYSQQHLAPLPKAHCLFETRFRNNTDTPQEYSFRTERSTRSVAELQLERSVNLGNEASIKLALPNSLFEANAGFKHELTLSSAATQSTEEELMWGVDTRITVPAKSSACAEVKIVEEQLTCQFRVITTLYGRIRAVFLDPAKNNAFVKYVEGDLGSIIEDSQRQRKKPSGDRPQCWTELRPGSNSEKMLFVESSGRCQFRFGVRQEVVATPLKGSSVDI